MPDLFHTLLLALLPGAGIIVGALLAEVLPTTRVQLSLALHFAAGVVFGVIAVALAPRAFGDAPAWEAALAFLAGGLFYVGVDWATEKLTTRAAEEKRSRMASAWVIFAAVAVDVFSDGLMVGTGSTVSMSLALVLAVGQVTADIPEGFVTVANFRSRGMPRARRLLVSASFLVPVLVGAFVSYMLLKGQTGPVRLLALAFVAGLLLVAAVEEIVGEAHDVACDKRWTSMAITAGFVLFALVDSYFEG